MGGWVLKAIAYAAVIVATVSCNQALAEEATASAAPAISVTRVTSSIPDGTPWMTAAEGPLCFPAVDLKWNESQTRINIRGFEKPIRDELKKEGFRIAKDPESPFPDDISPDLLIGARVTNIHSKFCIPVPPYATGSAMITVDWQIYSPRERKVVFSFQTNADAKSGQGVKAGYISVLTAAMGENVRALTASPEFKTLLAQQTYRRDDSPEARPGVNKQKIGLVGSLTAKSNKISDAIGAVVLILANDGHGSGVLISSDGYVLTDAHVLGSDKYVKIRWSDGLEGLGEVIRSDRPRDVAVIKTDPRGRPPLRLQTSTPEPGSTVFAIGAPEDPKLQSTVTRGVVSASNRIVDGFSFIQSDVTVNPGNSGGPLLDEKGEVLGLTDWKLNTRDGATGLNFFTPIGDALAFLSLEQR